MPGHSRRHGSHRYWRRAIALIDMNAFFASIEQRDFPDLLGKPVAVTNGIQGSCIITCSYEARAHGIHTGMRLPEARRRCPQLIQRPTRPQVYARVSTNIMDSLRTVCPDIEVFSVDEAFVDLSACQRLYGSAVDAARKLKQAVYQASGLPCSLGLSGDKTTAKYAAKRHKPDGFTVIPPWQAKAALAPVPVTELCGIANGIGGFLERHGVHRCGDMERLPISVLARRFGNPGRRIWYMCQGRDPEPLNGTVAAPKSIGHGKVLPPDTRCRNTLLTFFLHMSDKVGARMRRHHYIAQTYWIGLKAKHGWIGCKAKLPLADNQQQQIFALCRQVVETTWRGEGIFQIQVTALDPQPEDRQLSLFAPPETTLANRRLNRAMDRINRRYGDMTLSPARLLNRSTMPDVIAPAWKPAGLRKTV